MTAKLDFLCELCPAGAFTAEPNQFTCTNCSGGTASDTVGAATAEACTRCRAGTISEEGSEQCFDCITYSDASVRPLDSAQIDVAQRSCQCELGHYRLATPLADFPDYLDFRCVPCAAGTFQEEGLDMPRCLACPVGSYSDKVASGSASDCKLCGGNPEGEAQFSQVAGAAACEVRPSPQ